ncbi:hypothetical protein J3Q64DRAFT_1729486 [Phycomyces blakesleeanus]|uniref:Uncharacterized protein n=1 Tax=Phycomyces blakesleeanus TaxID=4837 RepID=A0ABR3B530_PHYBL
MESYKLELHPVRGQAHVCLFRNVTNAPELRQRLINQDATMACALVNAELVRFHSYSYSYYNDNLI